MQNKLLKLIQNYMLMAWKISINNFCKVLKMCKNPIINYEKYNLMLV